MASMTEELERAQATHDAILRLVCALPDPPHLGGSKCQPVSTVASGRSRRLMPHRARCCQTSNPAGVIVRRPLKTTIQTRSPAPAALRPKLERLACAAHKAARSDLEDHLTGNATCAWASVLENDAKAVWISGGSGGHRGVKARDRCVESVALDVIAVTAREAKALEKSARHLSTKPGYPPIGDCKRACAKLRKAAGLWESLESRRRPDAHRAVGCFARELWDDLREAPARGDAGLLRRRRFARISLSTAVRHRLGTRPEQAARLARRQIMWRRRREARGGAQRVQGRRAEAPRAARSRGGQFGSS